MGGKKTSDNSEINPHKQGNQVHIKGWAKEWVKMGCLISSVGKICYDIEKSKNGS